MRHQKKSYGYWHPYSNFQMKCKPFFASKSNYWKARSKYVEDISFNEEKNQYEVKLEVPGLSRDQVKIKASKEFLYITVHDQKNEDDEPTLLKYSFRQEVDLTAIKAKYNNGLVTVEIPLKESEKFDINVE